MTIVRSITSQPTSFSRLRACDGEISWSTKMVSICWLSGLATIPPDSYFTPMLVLLLKTDAITPGFLNDCCYRSRTASMPSEHCQKTALPWAMPKRHRANQGRSLKVTEFRTPMRCSFGVTLSYNRQRQVVTLWACIHAVLLIVKKEEFNEFQTSHNYYCS